MKKTTIPATDFGKKTYAQPRMRVVEIEEESLLCQSGSSGNPSPIRLKSGQGYEEEDW